MSWLFDDGIDFSYPTNDNQQQPTCITYTNQKLNIINRTRLYGAKAFIYSTSFDRIFHRDVSRAVRCLWILFYGKCQMCSLVLWTFLALFFKLNARKTPKSLITLDPYDREMATK